MTVKELRDELEKHPDDMEVQSYLGEVVTSVKRWDEIQGKYVIYLDTGK